MVEIKDGAFIISDAHYSSKNPELLNFFRDIKNKKFQPTQLILMGDIFELLFGGVQKTIDENQDIVETLEDISKEIEVIYLEGNHDFNLKSIFKNVDIYKISQQPLECKLDGKKVYLAHGDIIAPIGYKIYTCVIRNRVVLYILNYINMILNNLILDKLNRHLDKKDNCKKIENFEEIIKNRIDDKFECDYFIEGHFHQDSNIRLKNCNYVNLGAFACNQRYFVVRFSNKELLQSNKYLGD